MQLTERHQVLYDNLMRLVTDSEAFYFTDHVLGTTTYRIFLYRLASYTDFCLPDALECRGSMFEVDGDRVIRLAALPQPKFFNLGECPFTMDVDYSHDKIHSVMLKEDGSYINTFIHTDGEMYCKSKGSLSSDQAVWANKYLDRNGPLYLQLKRLTENGRTVNMEYCAPHNRIVLNYANANLIVLNIRDNISGDYIDSISLPQLCVVSGYGKVIEHWVEEAKDHPDYSHYTDNEKLIDDIPNLEGIEGIVVRLKSGLQFKSKTNWYLVQHRAKDSVDSPRRLFEAVITEVSDDLRSLFTDNQLVLDQISAMEVKAAGIYNHIVETVEGFVRHNKDLIEADDRKAFAIKGQKEFSKENKRFFGLVMMCYQRERGDGDGPNYKEFCIKNWRDWGLKDGPEDEE